VFHRLQAYAQAEQAWRDTVPLPAGSGLEEGVHAAQARGVPYQAKRRLDVTGLVGAGDADGEAATDPGIADHLDRGMCFQALRELSRGLRLPPDPQLQRLQAAQEQRARIGCGDDARTGAELLQALAVLGALADDRAELHVVMAAEVLGRAVQDEVDAMFQRSQVNRRRGRGV